MSILSVLYFLLLVMITSSSSLPRLLLNMPLQHSVHLDAGGETAPRVLFSWSATPEGVLVAEISAPALGYIGFGLSPNGGMSGSDILLMWVDDATGKAFLQDRYADRGNAEPSIDADQSSILAYEGRQNATHTTFRFARRLRAADCVAELKRNRNIDASQSARIIFSYSYSDPTPAPEYRAQYHGPINRGTVTLYLLDDMSGSGERDRLAALRETTRTVEFKANNFEIPSIDTYYQCEFFQLPEIKRDVQIIGFEPIIQPSSVRYVHHIVIRFCDVDYVRNASITPSAFNCNEPKAQVLKNRLNAAKCFFSMIWAWGIGGSATYMPHDAGYRLTPARDSGRYVVIETHYNNPARVACKRDSSGARLLLKTANDEHGGGLRPNDASQFYIGYQFGPEMVIPPTTTTTGAVSETARRFTIPSICPSSCTNKFVPSSQTTATGVKVFAVYLHAHSLARAVILRHFRADGRELPAMSADSNFDFNLQQWRGVQNVTLLPGDELLIECEYERNADGMVSFGGESTREEMCNAFIFTTPPIAMQGCLSQLPRSSIWRALEKNDELNEDEPFIPDLRQAPKNTTFESFLQSNERMKQKLKLITWTADKASKLQKAYYFDPARTMTETCATDDGSFTPIIVKALLT